MIYSINEAFLDRDGVFNSGDVKIAEYDYEVRLDGICTGAVEKFYDSAGVLDRTNTRIWPYDNLGRLVSEQLDSDDLDDYTDAYSFDLVGNRLIKTLKKLKGRN